MADAVLAAHNITRIAYLDDGVAADGLAKMIRDAGGPVACGGPVDTSPEDILWIEKVVTMPSNGKVAGICAKTGVGGPVTADWLADGLEPHGNAAVVLMLDNHPYRPFSLLKLPGGRLVIVNCGALPYLGAGLAS
jgi:hypothetical protein